MERLGQRWRREAADPGVAWALKDRFAGAIVELGHTRALVAGQLNAYLQSPPSTSMIAPEQMARLCRALDSLVELAALNARLEAAPSTTIVKLETYGRVTRLEKAARKALRDVVRALAIGAIGATLLVAMPAAADPIVGDPVFNPVTGVTEEIVEVLSPFAVRSNLGNIILLATTIGDTFTDPETGEAYQVTGVTLNAGGYVVGVTVENSASVTSTLDVVVDRSADITAGETPSPPGSDGSGTGDFTFPTGSGDSNNYTEANFGHNGGDGRDGFGVRVCIPYVGCATVAKSPSRGGNGQDGPSIVNTVVDSAWGDIHIESSDVPGIIVTSVGGNGGQGGDAYGNIKAASGGVAGKGGDVELTASVTVVTTGDNSHGIFAQSRAGIGGQGGKGYIASSGGSGGSPAQGGSVTVTNTGRIKTEGAGAFGILAQSLGGAAGSGGASYGVIGDGGGGSAGGNGGNVLVTHGGIIVTSGEDSHGIMAQSVGGSGGNAGKSVGIVTFGDKGAAGGDGGAASIVALGGSSTSTSGAGAFGLYAQSVGGGGGNGGRATGFVSLGSGGGAGGTGGKASIKIEEGAKVSTTGEGSHAVFAQSVGGGGG
ncbi:MAG: hypothetical protein KKE42_01145, partial [Alphaproteobacteria bacterium]|nr:hypothetical protein [Alphaproteobacteria bacterium]